MPCATANGAGCSTATNRWPCWSCAYPARVTATTSTPRPPVSASRSTPTRGASISTRRPVCGVGFSFNPYAWSEYIDPKAGVLRLVFGLGTRAVDRSDDDYTRIVALNAPSRRPEANFDEMRKYSQRRVDYVDLAANQVVSGQFVDVVADSPGLPLELFTETVGGAPGSKSPGTRLLSFDHLITDTDFVQDMREVLGDLEGAYACPVDIEFTANFFVEDTYSINILQRPGGHRVHRQLLRRGHLQHQHRAVPAAARARNGTDRAARGGVRAR